MSDFRNGKTNGEQDASSWNKPKSFKISKLWSFMWWISNQEQKKNSIQPKLSRKVSLNDVEKGYNVHSLKLLYKEMRVNPEIIFELINFKISKKEFSILKWLIKNEIRRLKWDCSNTNWNKMDDSSLQQTKQFVRK